MKIHMYQFMRGILRILLLLLLGGTSCNAVNGQVHPVINEIMVNPRDGSLPDQEWIEIYNPHDIPVRLSMYSLSYNSRSLSLPDVFLSARQYLILTSADNEHDFAGFGNVSGLRQWPQLNNSNGVLALHHLIDGVVDEVRYSASWYRTPRKRVGGWSLERINPTFVCDVASNWAETESPRGGTPGQRNSMYDIGYLPEIQVKEAVVSEYEVRLIVDVGLEGILDVHKVNAEPEIGGFISSIFRQDTLVLSFDRALRSGVPYHLQLSGIYCNTTFLVEHTVFHNEPVDFNDVVINEVLFHPKSDGVDFVELYNRSNKIINLQDWQLGNRLLTNQLQLFDPGTYYVITTDASSVQQHYPSAILDQSLILPSLPAYANQQGVVTLYNREQLIDSLYYQSSMHQPFLSNPAGISLERQFADVGTNDFGNFTSASSYSEGATPGYENSKGVHSEADKQPSISLLSKTFSPDGDQQEDELIIQYNFGDGERMVNVVIFDDRGQVVNRLVRNLSAGHRGQFIWEGYREDGTEAPAGVYICLVETYDAQGAFRAFRESCVLVRRGQGY